MYVKAEIDISPRSYSLHAVTTPVTEQMALRATDTGYFECGARYDTRRSGMEQYLLLVTLSGSGTLEYEGGRHALSPGTAMLIDCRPHQEYRTEGNSWTFKYCHFAGTEGELLYRLITGGEHFVIPLAHPGRAEEELDAILNLDGIDSLEKALSGSAVLHGLLANLYAERTPLLKTRRVTECTVAYIRQHYAQQVTLEQLADAAGLSKYHYLNLFKQEMRMTPGDYLASFRVNKAKELLRATPLSVEEIAERTGYLNPSSFIRAFRARTGLTPLCYRRA